MLLSVIIPSYNDGKYLSKALRSVYDQSFTDFEVIIINDGSTDNTDQICKRWVHKYSNIKLINQDNKGSSIARQTGIVTAEGDYCLFLDADDWFCDNTAFEKLVTYMENSDVDVLQFLMEKNYFGKGKPVSGTEGSLSIQEFWSNDCSTLLGGNKNRISPYICDKIYRTDIFKKAVTEHSVERIYIFDYIYMNLLYFDRKEVQKIAYVPWLLYSWRQYSGGIFKCTEELMDDYEVLKPLQLSIIHKHNMPESYIKQCHVETAYLFNSVCSKAARHRIMTFEYLKELYSFPSVQLAIEYFNSKPSGLWDIIYDFCNVSDEKLHTSVKKLNSDWKGKLKNLYIILFC